MKSPEHFEEVTIKRGCVRNSRVAEQQCEDRTECRPEHHRCEDGRDLWSIDLFHHQRDHESRFGVRLIRHKLSPGHNSDNRQIDGKVNNRYRDYANDDRTWNRPARVPDLVTDITDVVIAQVVINADARGSTQAEKKTERERKGPRWKIKSAGRAEMKCSGDHNCQSSKQGANPQTDGNLADRSDAAIEQHDINNAHHRGYH